MEPEMKRYLVYLIPNFKHYSGGLDCRVLWASSKSAARASFLEEQRYKHMPRSFRLVAKRIKEKADESN